MDSKLLVRSRTAFCTDLVHRSLSRTLNSSGHLEVATSHQIIVRFQPFETELLKTVEEYLSPETLNKALGSKELDKLATHLLYRWSWGADVLRQLLTDLNPIEVDHKYNGSQLQAFKMVTTYLAKKLHDQCDETRFRRTQQLVIDNAAFISKLGHIEMAKIDIVPHADDKRLWRSLALLFLTYFDQISQWKGFRPVAELSGLGGDPESDDITITKNNQNDASSSPEETRRATALVYVEGLLDLEDTWDVWRFCRMIRLLEERPQNSEQVAEFTSIASFTQHWKEESGTYHGWVAEKSYQAELVSSTTTFFKPSFLQELTLQYGKRTFEKVLEDPSWYLEYIPWYELIDLEPSQSIDKLLAALDLENDNKGKSLFRLWKTNRFVRHCHTLYINEDMYTHSILGGFVAPGTCIEDRIIFACQPVEDSLLCEQMRSFWQDWNDCAITQRPEDGRFFILETLPGRKFRQLKEKVGKYAPQTFFSAILRQHLHPKQQESVQDLLGPNYERSYSYLLQYIDPEELVDLTPLPVGEGSYGKVFRATWTNMPMPNLGFEETTSGEVAIKMALNRNQDQFLNEKKFFQELRIINTALAGDSGFFLKFLGFSRLFTNSSGQLFSSPASGRSSVFVLLFEYLTEGTILDFLTKHLEQGQILDNWKTLCTALEGVAIGLKVIHSQNVIHRDIHPNNVLVKKKRFTNSGDTDYPCQLADLGEGKTIEETAYKAECLTSSTSVRSVGLRAYQAPEIRGNIGYSKASDMYAFGQLGTDMIRMNYVKFQATDSTAAEIPAKLVDILETCKKLEPGKRYSAALVVFMLEEVLEILGSGKVDWVTDFETSSHSAEGWETLHSIWSSK